jgi:hypothetical protein
MNYAQADLARVNGAAHLLILLTLVSDQALTKSGYLGKKVCTRIFKSWRRAVMSVLINMLSKPLTRTSR